MNRMMKTLLLRILLCVPMLGLTTACSSDEEAAEGDVRLHATPASLHFGAAESSLQISVSTDARWSVECGAEWLSVDPVQGEGAARVSVRAQANDSAQERSSQLTIRYGRKQQLEIPVAQDVARRDEVPLFDSPEALKTWLRARIEACNYAESVSSDGDILKFSFADAGTHGVRKSSVPLFTVNTGGYWAADGAATAAKADMKALRAGIPPPVESTGTGSLSIGGADTGIAVPGANPAGLRCVLHTGKFLCFAFSDGDLIQVGSEIDRSFNPPLTANAASVKILFIGNSFTVDATEHLPGMLRSAGIGNVRMVRAYHGGYKLPEFYENYSAADICTYYYCEPGGTKWESTGSLNRSLESIVASDTWDIVTLQEHTGSKYAWEWSSAEQDAILGLCDKIRRAQPRRRPTICYIMSQAYGRNHATMYPRYFPDQLAMFRAIVAQVEKITEQTCIDIVIPTGTTLQNLRTSSLNNAMDLTRDTYHMDYGISRYAAAATVFHTLVTPCTGVGVEGNAYRYSNRSESSTAYSTPVTDANAPTAIDAALKACASPYTITDMR